MLTGFHFQGKERAGIFVRDFIVTQLVGKLVSELWDIKDPMGLLTNYLEKQNEELPEPRYFLILTLHYCVVIYFVTF